MRCGGMIKNCISHQSQFVTCHFLKSEDTILIANANFFKFSTFPCLQRRNKVWKVFFQDEANYMKSVEKLGNLFSFYKDGCSCARSQKPPGVQFKQHCTNHLSKTKAVVKNSASKPLLSFPWFILFRDMATPQHNLLFEGSILFLCQNAQRPRNFMTIGVFFPGWNGILWVLVMIITIYIPGDFSLNSLETWIKPWRPHLKKDYSYRWDPPSVLNIHR